MGLSTEIPGPYDRIPTQDKTRLMCGIPSDIVNELFPALFPRRGVQDKILARLFHLFYMELTSESVAKMLTEAETIHDKEQVLNQILNKLAKLQNTNENIHE